MENRRYENGRTVMNAGPRLTIWRAPIDNEDRGAAGHRMEDDVAEPQPVKRPGALRRILGAALRASPRYIHHSRLLAHTPSTARHCRA